MALLFPILAGAENSLVWTTNYYSITGTNLGELRQSLRASRPWNNKFAVDGRTDWRIEWKFKFDASAGGCRCSSFTTKTTITTTLPSWRAPTNAPPTLTKTWVRYFTTLAQHEAGHAQFALDAVAEQHERIKEVGEEPDCAALKKKINALANQIVDDYRQRDKEYDQRTEHGVKQGAVLLGPIRKSDPKPE